MAMDNDHIEGPTRGTTGQSKAKYELQIVITRKDIGDLKISPINVRSCCSESWVVVGGLAVG